MPNQRLFIAIELPESVKGELRSMVIECPGLRPTKMDNLHLTLHFIGQADVERIASVLEPISDMASCFEITLTGTGTFFSRGRGVILWTGVDLVSQLAQLHADMGALLQNAGFAVDVRPFKPHITLARGERVDEQQVRNFLRAHGEYRAIVRVDSVCLMSSRLNRGGSIYSVERRFLLTASR